jgi:hypothetical protein
VFARQISRNFYCNHRKKTGGGIRRGVKDYEFSARDVLRPYSGKFSKLRFALAVLGRPYDGLADSAVAAARFPYILAAGMAGTG